MSIAATPGSPQLIISIFFSPFFLNIIRVAAIDHLNFFSLISLVATCMSLLLAFFFFKKKFKTISGNYVAPLIVFFFFPDVISGNKKSPLMLCH
jgi:hypothetical protein